MISQLLKSLPQSEFGTAIRIVVLGAIVFLAGRAFVALFFAPSPHFDPPLRRNSGYLAVASGPVALLLLTRGLTLVHAYSFNNVVVSLLAIVVLAIAANKDFRSIFQGWQRCNAIVLFTYIGSALAFWILLSPAEYDGDPLKGTSQYLIQGFDLSFESPGTFPLYGKMIVAPLLYSGYTISATFALFSYDDHFLYYAFGEYWLNLIIGPLIPIGACLFFRRFLSSWPSILATLAFCIAVLDFKIWSLRGESLAWIPGFAFLILLIDYLSASHRSPGTIWAVRYIAGMALMFLALALTHGVTMLMVLFLSVGIALRFLLAQPSAKSAGCLVASVLLFGVFVGAIFSGFAAAYSSTILVENHAIPLTGELDAAMEYDNATSNLPPGTDMRIVSSRPPYVSRLTAVRMAAVLPPASLFHRGMAFFRIRDFPAAPIHALYDELPPSSLYIYPALLLGGCLFFLLFPSAVSLRLQALFWAAASVYLLNIVLTLYLDSQSVSLFPIASVRRTFPYSAAFYWMGVAITAVGIVSSLLKLPNGGSATIVNQGSCISIAPTSARIADICRKMRSRMKSESKRIQGAVALACGDRYLPSLIAPHWAPARWREAAIVSLIPLWFVYSINSNVGGPPTVFRLGKRVVERLSDAVRPSPNGAPALLTLKPLFDAVAFIRDRTAVGELVYANVLSEDLFWFLSSGRVSMFDGTSIYQLYFLQQDSARRVRRFANFALTADLEDVQGFNFKYALIYTGKKCGEACYGFPVFSADLHRFARNPLFKVVFENSVYVVFERTDIPAGSPAPWATSPGDRSEVDTSDWCFGRL